MLSQSTQSCISLNQHSVAHNSLRWEVGGKSKRDDRFSLSKINLTISLDLTDVIDDSLQATYQRFNEIPDPKLPVKYPRTPGYRPTGPNDNPYNTW